MLIIYYRKFEKKKKKQEISFISCSFYTFFVPRHDNPFNLYLKFFESQIIPQLFNFNSIFLIQAKETIKPVLNNFFPILNQTTFKETNK